MQMEAEDIFRSLKAIDDFKSNSFQILGKNHGQAMGLLLIRHISTTMGRDPRPSQLSEQARVMPATITAMLRRLEERGLICREYSTQDRREVIIRLTEQGNQVCDEIISQIKERFHLLTEFVGEDSIRQFYEFALKLESFNKLEVQKGQENTRLEQSDKLLW